MTVEDGKVDAEWWAAFACSFNDLRRFVRSHKTGIPDDLLLDERFTESIMSLEPGVEHAIAAVIRQDPWELAEIAKAMAVVWASIANESFKISWVRSHTDNQKGNQQ